MNIVIIDIDYNFCNGLAKFFKNSGNFNIAKTFNNIHDALSYIDENKKMLDLIIVDLEFENKDVDTLLSIASKNCNVIAFSENLEIIDKYINYPYFQRVFKKPISFSVILNYISLQNNIETFENYRKNVLKNLSKLGFNINHSGTSYLVESTTLAVKTKMKKLSDIYTLIAYNHDTDPKIVGWSINNAINKTVKISKNNELQTFFNIQKGQKLTAKSIISHFVNFDNTGDF